MITYCSNCGTIGETKMDGAHFLCGTYVDNNNTKYQSSVCARIVALEEHIWKLLHKKEHI